MAKPKEQAAVTMASSPSRLSPPQVPMELHLHNRQNLLSSLRRHLSASSRPLQGFAFLQGGEEQTRYDTDHIELFRQESYFAYLFGVVEPGFYGAVDIASGKSILFAPRLPADYAVWLGEIKPLTYFKEKYMVSMVCYTDEIAKVLQDEYQESNAPLLFLLYGLNTDSDNYSKPAEFQGIDKFEADLTTLHPILTECRVIKSDLELAVIQFANDISSEAHVEVMRKVRVGMKEYQLESMFLHHTYMYGGCRHCSYTCICATGGESSVLHYGHAAAPNDRTLADGDMALLDMGAEYNFYGSDITCSFPVNGKFTPDQSLVYNAVLDAHNAVIDTMKPGVCWVDMHELAEKIILESLRRGGVLVGNVDDMMVERVGAVFMPHGLGHFLGIDTHDPGGYSKGMERPKEPGLKSLRTIRKLQEGLVITVEPGCYFIDALLVPAMENSNTARFFNHEAITRFKGFGGVRIESDLHVTADGCKNLTNVPRKIHEIEAVMAGAPWPLDKGSVYSAVKGKRKGELAKKLHMRRRRLQRSICKLQKRIQCKTNKNLPNVTKALVSSMGRRKNDNNDNQASGSFSNMASPHESTKIRFQYDDDDDDVVDDVGTLDAATESSNLDESMSDPVGDQDVSILDADDKTSADYYFDSYSHFGIHEEMLKDVVRTKTYQNVIYQNKFLFKDKVVLDVGAGTGILSLFCAKAGAKHVYAVECSQMADMAKQIVEANGFSKVITVLKGKVEEIELPVPKVDIIVSEWMGYFLLFENMLNTVLCARDKWLVNDGIVLPDKASLYLTAIEDAEYKDDKIEFWNNVYGFSMNCIKKQAMMEPLVDTVDQNQIVTNSQLLKTMDVSKMAPGETAFTAPFKLVAERDDYIHAFVAYFDVSFTKCHKLQGFSTGPRSRATHWKQTVLYLEDVLTICQGEAIVGSMTVAKNKKNPRDVDITVKYSFNGRKCAVSRAQHYKMR